MKKISIKLTQGKKMKLLKPIVILSLSTSFLLAAPQNKKADEMDDVVKIGAKSSKILLKTLGSNMKKNMKSGGVMQALNFCSSEAYTLTQEVNKKLSSGVSIKRVSDNYRNPNNAPTSDELKVINAFKSLKADNIILPTHLLQKIDEHTIKFYKPLVLDNPVCLKCHGDISTNTELKKKIDEIYPADKAVNYKMGDLRGLVVVTIKK
jgi:hypothetical protein